MEKKLILVLAFILTFGLTLGASAYAQQFGKNEILHFWVAVSAGNVTKPVVLRGAGPPISLSPISIDLDQRGFLKNLFQPDLEALSTHWIYNLGKKPVRIRMELVNCSIPVEWEVNANHPYDPSSHTFTKPLSPGGSIQNLGIDWLFKFPKEHSSYYYLPSGAQVVYKGGLKLSDADTGELLTFIPIMFGRRTSTLGGDSCC